MPSPLDQAEWMWLLQELRQGFLHGEPGTSMGPDHDTLLLAWLQRNFALHRDYETMLTRNAVLAGHLEVMLQQCAEMRELIEEMTERLRACGG